MSEEPLAVRRCGLIGPRVLWIHGYTLDSFSWDGLWSRLPGWTHLGVDLPWHGSSPPLAPDIDMVGLARRIGRLAVAENARHLIGMSLGGMVALQTAIEFPDAFTTLTLGSSWLGGGPEDPHAQTRSRELTRLYKENGPGPWMTELWMSRPPDIFTGAKAQPPLWHALCEIINRHQWQELAHREQLRTLLAHRQSAEDLCKITAATLVAVGEDDIPAFKRCAELIRRAIPSAERAYFPGAGHLCLLESAAAPEAIHRHLTR